MLQVSNLTSSSAFYYSGDVGSGLIVPILFVVGVLILAVTSLERYKRIWSAITGIFSIIVTAVIGAITLGTVYLGYILFSMSADSIKGIDPKLYLYAAIGFAASVIVGYFVKWFAGKLIEYNKETIYNLKKQV
jgi:hypothetical protein